MGHHHRHRDDNIRHGHDHDHGRHGTTERILQHREDMRPILMTTSWTLLCACCVMVAARFYSRYTFSKISGDDWCIFIALLGLGTLARTHLHLVMHEEVGLHFHTVQTNLHPPHPQKDKIIVFILVYAYHISSTLVRVSVLIFLNRINPAYNFLRRLCYGFIALNAAVLTTVFASIAGTCGPVPMSVMKVGWKRIHPASTRCLECRKFTAAVPLALDLMVWTLPCVIVYKVRRKPSEKVLLAAVLCLGFSACIACGIRIPFTWKAIESDDPGWNHGKSQLLVTIEVAVGIIAASAPSLPALFSFTSEKLKRIASKNRGSAQELVVREGGETPQPPPNSPISPSRPPSFM